MQSTENKQTTDEIKQQQEAKKNYTKPMLISHESLYKQTKNAFAGGAADFPFDGFSIASL